ncbi:MAG: hypothetical protein ACODAJ_02230 [Planctomycetota bacterium]
MRRWLLAGGLALTALAAHGARGADDGEPPRAEPLIAESVSTSRWVFLGPDGTLLYARDHWGNRVPDYSYAGYRRGGVRLPVVPVRKVVEPDGDGEDDTARLQAAIDELSRLPRGEDGFRGSLLLKAGTYDIKGSLKIQASGVVLRGEGQTADEGTVLRATFQSEKKAYWTRQGWNHKFVIIGKKIDRREDRDSRREITTDYLPINSRTFEVESADGYAVGDKVLVRRRQNQRWCTTIMGHPLFKDAPDGEGKIVHDWGKRTAKPTTREAVCATITAIDGNTVTIDRPIYNVIAKAYGGGYLARYAESDVVKQVGLENLRLESVFEPDETGRDPQTHSPCAVSVLGGRDLWFRDVTCLYFLGTGFMVRSDRTTIQDCRVLMADPKYYEGLGYVARYGFNVAGAEVLVQRCYANYMRHSFNTGYGSSGPRVYLDCLSEGDLGGPGPHFGWVVGDLFDNVRVAGAELQNSTRGGTQWRGANSTFWNCGAVAIVVMQPPPAVPPVAYNWAIGCYALPGDPSGHREFYRGKGVPLVGEGPRMGNGMFESWGERVWPRSLFEAQLADRLGPEAVRNIRERVDWRKVKARR